MSSCFFITCILQPSCLSYIRSSDMLRSSWDYIWFFILSTVKQWVSVLFWFECRNEFIFKKSRTFLFELGKKDWVRDQVIAPCSGCFMSLGENHSKYLYSLFKVKTCWCDSRENFYFGAERTYALVQTSPVW